MLIPSSENTYLRSLKSEFLLNNIITKNTVLMYSTRTIVFTLSSPKCFIIVVRIKCIQKTIIHKYILYPNALCLVHCRLQLQLQFITILELSV